MLKLPIKVPTGFHVIAHRGASGYAPENTLAAFRLAEHMGCVEIEFDIQFSKDRNLIICHDRALDRYGYPGMRVEDLTLDELLLLDMGSWFSPYLYGGEPMLTLEQLLEIFRDRFIYHVEIKVPSEGIVAKLLSTIKNHGTDDQTIITSFDFDALREVQSQAPEMRVGWLVSRDGLSGDNLARASKAGFFQICPRADEMDREKVNAAHAWISEVRAHSVTGLMEMLQAIDAGCDGLTINWPDWLVHEEMDGLGEISR
jgi:glycerophosphoryl diester phosphodiesterase